MVLHKVDRIKYLFFLDTFIYLKYSIIMHIEFWTWYISVK